MRYLPTTALYTTAAEAAISQLSPPPPPASDAADNVPGSSSTRDADSIHEVVPPSAITILIVLLSIFISVIALNAAIKFFLTDDLVESHRRREREKVEELSAAVAAVTSTVKYTARRDCEDREEAAAAAAECAICLAEFEEGEEMKVLRNCGHEFHGRCIERWFVTSQNSSCPTCRRSCLPSTTPLSPVAASLAIATSGDG